MRGPPGPGEGHQPAGGPGPRASPFPGFRLDLVGEGPIARGSRRPGRGGSRRVALLGQRSDIPALLQGADLFLLASISEGISLTLLEAMAAGLPIVATAVGGNREVVVDGETGFLVPRRDPVAFAEAVCRLLSSQELRAQMGAAARRRAESHFDVRRMASRYQELYLRLLAHTRIAP
jgi:glycosyltransferase involved in cell wall biosynthesis